MTARALPKIQLSAAPGGADNYAAAVRAAGGEPVPGYCPEPDESCAGLILCGGGDLDSALFGQPDLGSNPPDPRRDRAELELFWAFYRAGKPVLGICRGMQVINVALGGTLVQDLPRLQKTFHAWDGRDRVHPVASREGSPLRRLYGPLFSVNSAHHQAVDRLGSGLRAAAWTESGVVEAVDCPGQPLLGVQFHPERMAFHALRPDAADGGAIFFWFLSL